MSPIQIALVNSSNLSDTDVADGLRALQQQVREDFAPVWHVDAELRLVTRKEACADARPGDDCQPLRLADHWALVLIDERLAAERLGRFRLRGYHDLTAAGLPIARVFVNRIGPGQDWTFVASHELLEMLADPDCNAAAYRHPDAATTLIYAREICDPCAAYANGYEKCGRWVSDFVFPDWFSTNAPRRGTTRFDERGLAQSPFEVLAGGYIGVYDPGISGWTILGADGSVDEIKDVGSRMERRNVPDNRWLDSDMSTAP